MDDDEGMYGDAVKKYYESIDAHEYDALRSILDVAFSHHRPDTTITGRERFIGFMRDERPLTDTIHSLRQLFRPMARTSHLRAAPTIAARGTLLDADEDPLFQFVDVHEFGANEAIETIYTYTR